MGEHLLGPLEDREIRMSTGFAGGIGGTYKDHCGAFSAGIMVIGGLFGRTSSDVNDQVCQALAAEYRDRFKIQFKTLICGELREEKYGSQGAEPCSTLVERASRILLEVIRDYEGGNL